MVHESYFRKKTHTLIYLRLKTLQYIHYILHNQMTESINLPNISCFNHSTKNEMAFGIELPNRIRNSIKKSEMKLNQNSSPTTKKQKDFRQTTKNYIFHAPKKQGPQQFILKDVIHQFSRRPGLLRRSIFLNITVKKETILVAETRGILDLPFASHALCVGPSLFNFPTS